MSRILCTTFTIQRVFKWMLLLCVLYSGWLLVNILRSPTSLCDPATVCHGMVAKETWDEVGGKRMLLVVLVMTAPKYRDRRDTIRHTWLQDVPGDVKVYFVVGIKKQSSQISEELINENRLYGDLMILEDFEDSYSKLTEKILTSFTYVEKSLKLSYKFLLKCDDDTFVVVKPFLEDLRQRPTSRLYWGFFDGRARVKRSGQWQEKKWFLSDRYLPHALGGGYILTRDLVQYIAHTAPLLQIYNSEDVSVGTWLSPLDIKRVHDVRFDTEWKTRGCHNQYLITHKQTIENMKEKHHNLRTQGYLCSKEHRVMLSYIYRWNVPPSKCCIREDPSIP